jgi:hypothetical protein
MFEHIRNLWRLPGVEIRPEIAPPCDESSGDRAGDADENAPSAAALDANADQTAIDQTIERSDVRFIKYNTKKTADDQTYIDCEIVFVERRSAVPQAPRGKAGPRPHGKIWRRLYSATSRSTTGSSALSATKRRWNRRLQAE